MSMQRLVGIVLLVGGLVLLILGLDATDSVADTVKEGLTGKYTDETLWYILGGLAASILGVGLTFFGGGRPRRA